jgi:hypothetical protein
VVPAECPQGYFCPSGTGFAGEHPCPAGTYGPASVPGGLRTSFETGCELCTNGSYCLSSATVPLPCPQGFFCPAGTDSFYRYPCPLGTYGAATNLDRAEECTDCPAGHYCPAGDHSVATVSPLPCPPGTYNPLMAAGSEHNCIPCPAGTTCPASAQIAVTDPCGEGHYCPRRTVTNTQYPCPPGTFTGSTNLTSAEECTTCPPGA